MNTLFSIEDFSDSFWEAPPLSPEPPRTVAAEAGVSRSESEWTFEMFLEEMSSSVSALSASLSATANAIGVSPEQSRPSVSGPEDVEDDVGVRNHYYDRESMNPKSALPSDTASKVPADSDEYRRVLKSRLDIECGDTVALRATSAKPEASSRSTEIQTQPAQSGTRAQGPELAQSKSALPAEQKKSGVQMKQATSGSSREDSDDDDLEGDTETIDNMDPEDVKRARRMLSNRESARRSRRRKQEQMNELETQVGQLKIEHSSLLKQLSDVNHKYDEAAVGNRILKAHIETLRAKVKMAEETVKRVTGMNPLLLGRSNGYNSVNPLIGNRMNSSCITALQGHSNLNHISKHQIPDIALPNVLPPRLQTSFSGGTLASPILNSENSTLQAKSTLGEPELQSMGNGQKQVGSTVVNEHAASDASPFRPAAVPRWSHGLAHRVPENNSM